MTSACPTCGVSYDLFRASIGYRTAYHQIAYGREHTSRKAVLGHLGHVKRDEWEQHVDTCDAWDAEAVSFDFGALEGAPVERPTTALDLGALARMVRREHGTKMGDAEYAARVSEAAALMGGV